MPAHHMKITMKSERQTGLKKITREFEVESAYGCASEMISAMNAMIEQEALIESLPADQMEK